MTVWGIVAEQLSYLEDPQAYTQAIMDLGATVCTRTKPVCIAPSSKATQHCPLSDLCVANQTSRQLALPLKKKRIEKKRQVKTFYIYSYSDECSDDYILLERRPNQGVWGGLYTFPEGDVNLFLFSSLMSVESSEFSEILLDEPIVLDSGVHLFTHIHLTYDIVFQKVHRMFEVNESFFWIKVSDLDAYAMPSIFQVQIQGALI